MTPDLFKQNEGTSYRSVLDSLEGEIITCSDLIKLSSVDKKYIILRHDIDDKITNTINMASVEYELGLRATYYPQNTSKWFDYSDVTFKLCKNLNNLGQYVGFHNDVLYDYFYNNISIKDAVSKPLGWFRDHNVDIRGTSAHGNMKLYKEYGLKNEQIWSECAEPDPRFEQVSLDDYNLLYESYFFPYDAYLTDIYNTWVGFRLPGVVSIDNIIMDVKEKIIDNCKNEGLDIIKYFNSLDKGIMQILIHPGRWYTKGGIIK